MPLLIRQLAFVALLLTASQPAWAEFILFPELNGIPLRLIGELYFVSNDLATKTGITRASFVNYNLQAEYTLHPNWILYARAEDT